MLITTNWYSFDAILKSTEGETLAAGTATVSVPQQSVTFESDFVPLYPIGTPMEIVRIQNEQEIHRFTGKVYLSDKKLMRIVSVNDELLPGSEQYYTEKLNISAMLLPCAQEPQAEPPQKKRQLFRINRKKEEPKPQERHIQIIGLSEEKLIFQFEQEATIDLDKQGGVYKESVATESEIKQGQHFFVKIEAPLEMTEPITVCTPYYFGQQSSYLCEFSNLPLVNTKKINDFLWAYNLANHKIF